MCVLGGRIEGAVEKEVGVVSTGTAPCFLGTDSEAAVDEADPDETNITIQTRLKAFHIMRLRMRK